MYLSKKNIVIFFITCNVFFIFLQIYNHTRYIQQTYTKQTYEKKYDILCKKKQKYTQQLYALKDPIGIKEFARNILHMQSTKLEQVRKIA
ncbi:MAG: hypothetical protein WCD44_00785 [Candidatus Babeliales bacterium]